MAKLDLTKYGITGTTEVVYNPSYEQLFEEETKPGLEGYEKGQVSELGAVNVMTGVYTGRSPKDKFIVMDENSKDTVWWTSDEYKNDNHPASQEAWKAVKEIAQKELLVVVDEAYVDFGGESVLPLLQKYDNLIVVQTFSKSRAMAGERIGFAIGSTELIKALHDVKYSFNSYTMNRSALAAGTASVQDSAYLQEITAKIVATREHTKQVLAEMGFQFPDSKSNFLFVTHPDCDAHELFEALRQAHIFVYTAVPTS